MSCLSKSFTCLQLRFGTSVYVGQYHHHELRWPCIPSQRAPSDIDAMSCLRKNWEFDTYRFQTFQHIPNLEKSNQPFVYHQQLPLQLRFEDLRIWDDLRTPHPSTTFTSKFPFGLPGFAPRPLLASPASRIAFQWVPRTSAALRSDSLDGFCCWPQDTISAKQMAHPDLCANVQCVSVRFYNSIQFLYTDVL